MDEADSTGGINCLAPKVMGDVYILFLYSFLSWMRSLIYNIENHTMWCYVIYISIALPGVSIVIGMFMDGSEQRKRVVYKYILIIFACPLWIAFLGFKTICKVSKHKNIFRITLPLQELKLLDRGSLY